MAMREKDLEKVKEIGVRKMAFQMTRLYNKLCNSCKMVTIMITKRGEKVALKHYCPTCQEMAEKILKKLEGEK